MNEKIKKDIEILKIIHNEIKEHWADEMLEPKLIVDEKTQEYDLVKVI